MATIPLTIHFISKVCSINSGKLINLLSLIEKRQRISAGQLLSTVRANGIFIQDESRISLVLLRLSLLFHWAEEWATNQTLFSFISECDKLSTSFFLPLSLSLSLSLSTSLSFLGCFCWPQQRREVGSCRRVQFVVGTANNTLWNSMWHVVYTILHDYNQFTALRRSRDARAAGSQFNKVVKNARTANRNTNTNTESRKK